MHSSPKRFTDKSTTFTDSHFFVVFLQPIIETSKFQFIVLSFLSEITDSYGNLQ